MAEGKGRRAKGALWTACGKWLRAKSVDSYRDYRDGMSAE